MKLRNLLKKIQKMAQISKPVSGRWSVSRASTASWDGLDAIITDSDSESSPHFLPADVPQGCLPLYVGQHRQRFVVRAENLNHPLFKVLLDHSAEELGFDHKGALVLMCEVHVFKQILCHVESKLCVD